MHCPQDILLCRLAHRILLIIGQDNHVLSRIAKIAIEVGRHVLHVVDASPQLSSLPKVVDADQQSLPSSSTIRVLESVSLRCATTKTYRALRGWRRRVGITVDKGIRVH